MSGQVGAVQAGINLIPERSKGVNTPDDTPVVVNIGTLTQDNTTALIRWRLSVVDPTDAVTNNGRQAGSQNYARGAAGVVALAVGEPVPVDNFNGGMTSVVGVVDDAVQLTLTGIAGTALEWRIYWTVEHLG